MAVKQPAAYSPGSSRVERGLFGQTSKACRGEGKNEAVREAGAGGGPVSYTDTPLSRGRPGPRGRSAFLAGLGARRRPRDARGSAQPRSL